MRIDDVASLRYDGDVLNAAAAAAAAARLPSNQ